VVQVGYLPSTPRPTDCHQNWHGLSRRGGNQSCQILNRLVQGFQNPRWPKIAISHWLATSPLQQLRTTVLHCDKTHFIAASLMCDCTKNYQNEFRFNKVVIKIRTGCFSETQCNCMGMLSWWLLVLLMYMCHQLHWHFVALWCCGLLPWYLHLAIKLLHIHISNIYWLS